MRRELFIFSPWLVVEGNILSLVKEKWLFFVCQPKRKSIVFKLEILSLHIACLNMSRHCQPYEKKRPKHNSQSHRNILLRGGGSRTKAYLAQGFFKHEFSSSFKSFYPPAAPSCFCFDFLVARVYENQA